MGTTLVVALFYDNKMTVAHIGDSRLYRLRGGELRQVTKDHSLLQEQIDSGVITPQQPGSPRTRIWLRARSASIRLSKRRSTTTRRSRKTFICSVPTAFVIW